MNARKCLQLLVLLILAYPTGQIRAQVPHGGQPLAESVEGQSSLRAKVDYMVDMPSFDLDSVRAIDNLPGNRMGGLKFAHKFFVQLKPENSGIVFHTEDGTKVWKVGLRSKGAYSINLLFDQFTLPEGAKLFLYNAERTTVLGAFTKENRPEGGEFSVSPVDGEEIIVEYQEPANVAFSGKISITEVNHDYRGLFRLGGNPYPDKLPCLPNISCNSQLDSIGSSVCLLIINGDTYCTGSLINNTSNDGTPYLITASHCFGSSGNMNDMETRLEWGKRVVAFLHYEAPRCDKRIRGSENFSVSGSVTKAISKDIDFALLKLTELPPADYRPYLAGWSLDTTTHSDLPFTCIQHPDGDLKKYCTEEDSVSKIDWNYGQGIAKGNHWHIQKWETGHTWYGSSGAPLFDKNNRFRGALTGGDSGGDNGCGEYQGGDFFFRLDRAWNQYPDSSKQLKYWLDPLTPATAESPKEINGLNPYYAQAYSRISNLTPSDTLGVLHLNAPRKGPVFGYNSLGLSSFAEHFTLTSEKMIQGVYLVAASGRLTWNLPITIRVYQGGAKPGKIIGIKILNPSYQVYAQGGFKQYTDSGLANREQYIRFDSPISVGTDFYVGYEIRYPETTPEENFYVYSAIRKNTVNSSYFMQNDLWYPFSSLTSQPIYTSLWMEPVVSDDTTTTSVPFYGKDSIKSVYPTPVVSYSLMESTFYISLPKEWQGKTKMELFDFKGYKLYESILTKPREAVPFSASQGKFFIVRLWNENQRFTSKIVTAE